MKRFYLEIDTCYDDLTHVQCHVIKAPSHEAALRDYAEILRRANWIVEDSMGAPRALFEVPAEIAILPDDAIIAHYHNDRFAFGTYAAPRVIVVPLPDDIDLQAEIVFEVAA